MEKLKELRLKYNYSFREMGEFLGISKTFYWQIEHDQRRLSYNMAIKIANIFKTTPDNIFLKEMKDRNKK